MEEHTANVSNLAAGAGIGLISRIGGRFINILQSLVAARVLGPGLFGLYMLGWTLFRLIELVAPLGFDYGIIKFGQSRAGLTEKGIFKGLIVWSLMILALFSAIFVGLTFLLAPWLANTIFGKAELEIVFRLFGLAVPLAGFLGLLAAASRITHNMKYSAVTQDLGQPICSLILISGFYFIGLNLQLVIISDIFSYLITALLAAYLLRGLFPFVFRQEVAVPFPDRDYFRFSLIASLSVFLTTLVFWVDRLFVGYYLSPGEMGVYQAALQVSVIFAVILSALNRILLPLFASLHKENKIGDLEEIFRVGTKWSFYLGLPFASLLLLNSDSILRVLYGDAYSMGGVALSILLTGQIVNLATGAVGPLLLIGGHQRIIFMTSVAVLGVNCMLCIFLIPVFGVQGAAMANAVSVTCLYLLSLFFVQKKMGLWPYDGRYLKGVAAVCLAVVSALAVKYWMQVAPVLEILIQAAVIGSVFIAALYLLRFDSEDKVFIGILQRRAGLGSQVGNGNHE